MVEDAFRAPVTATKDGRDWRIGSAAEVAWISEGTDVGLEITAAIPPIFEAYATIVVPHDRVLDQVLLTMLADQTPPQPWWLGYLDTGADDVVFPDAPKVTLYQPSWHYVFVVAGPHEAATWRDGELEYRTLPDVIFPTDCSWLLSTLWDDDWRCLGGPADLIERVHRDADLEARVVRLGEDATPPGHQAF
jgi:hypothetical protein